MFGRKKLQMALEMLAQSLEMAKKFSNTLDETKRFLELSMANEKSWREAAQQVKPAEKVVATQDWVVVEVNPNGLMN